MKTLEAIRESLPAYARDLQLNLGSVLTPSGAPGLTERQIWAVALASALASRNAAFSRDLGALAASHLDAAHITAAHIRYIDKETSSMWAQGDDLSVLPDDEETGFRVIEYGKRRKVRLPDSVKREIRAMGL